MWCAFLEEEEYFIMVLNHIFNYDITPFSGSFFYQCTPLALCVTIHADLGRICIADTITTFFPKNNLSYHLYPPPQTAKLSLPSPSPSLPSSYPLSHPPSFCYILKRNLFQRLSLQSFNICLQNQKVSRWRIFCTVQKAVWIGREWEPPLPPPPAGTKEIHFRPVGGGGGSRYKV